jgi:hypothetical protein
VRTKHINVPEKLKQMPIWTLSTKDKFPVNFIETIKQNRIIGLTARNKTQTVDYYTLCNYILDTALITMTIPEGYMIVDVESYASDELKNYCRTLNPIYAETSMSGKGMHLLFEYPKNYTKYPNAMNRSVIKSKDKTFEILFDHACIFTGNQIYTTGEHTVDTLYASVAKHITEVKDIIINNFEPLTDADRPVVEYLMNSGLYSKDIFKRSDGTVDTSAFDFATVANWYNMIKIYYNIINQQLPSYGKIVSILYYVATKKIYRDKFEKIVTADKSENYLTHLIKSVIKTT